MSGAHRDSFDDELPPGRVIGSRAPGGFTRRGADAERHIAIDHGALRIGHLDRPGWGRAAIAYGPFEPAAGLLATVHVLNGHNASDADEIARMRGRESLPRWRRALDRRRHPVLEANLAFGWFSRADRPGRLGDALALSVRGAEGENGELCAVLGGRLEPLRSGLRNVPQRYAVLLRDRGATYYAGSLPGTPGLPGGAELRPLAISTGGSGRYAGLHQAVLGQAGYRVDTRVYGIHVEAIPELASWHGTAHAADALTGEGAPFPEWAAEGWTLTPAGAEPGAEPALRECPQPSGLLHVELAGAGVGGLVWRGGAWSAVTGPGGTSLLLREKVIAHDPIVRRHDAGPCSVQVSDDGETIDVRVDGRHALAVRDTRFAEQTAAGIRGDDVRLQRFEAHPRAVRLPASTDLPGPAVAEGGAELAGDGFGGAPGELDGREADRGAGRHWARRLGTGAIDCEDAGRARVRAALDRPHPGPAFHTIAWPDHGFADLAVVQTPPGRSRGEGHRGRVGLVFWGGPGDHLVVNTWLDDAYDGTAVSSFLTIGGHHDHFRAVWCNVGRTISWGERSVLRVAFDHGRWTVWVGTEPVLQRDVSDLHPRARAFAIREVGIAVNEEYGNDTGTIVHDFSARTPR